MLSENGEDGKSGNKKRKLQSGLEKAANNKETEDLSEDDLETGLATSAKLLEDPLGEPSMDKLGAHKKVVKQARAKAKAEGQLKPKAKAAPNQDLSFHMASQLFLGTLN